MRSVVRSRAGMIGGALALFAFGAACGMWLDGRIEDAATARSGVRHAALHINCPPGSHGVPRYSTFGRSLGYGPDGEKTPRLRDRGIMQAFPARRQAGP